MNYQCAPAVQNAPQRGSGGTPQKIVVVTCSEIDSNAVWQRNEGTAALRVLVVKPHIHLNMSYKMHCFEL